MQTRTFFVDLGSVAVFAMILGLTVWLENLKGLKNKSGGFVQEHLGGCGNQLKQHETNYRFRKFQEMNSGAQGISGSDSVANKWHGPWSSYMVIWWERQSGPKVERLNNTKIENTNRQSPKSLLRLFFCIFTYFRWTHRHIIVILPWYRHKKSHLFLLNATFLIAPPVL